MAATITVGPNPSSPPPPTPLSVTVTVDFTEAELEAWRDEHTLAHNVSERFYQAINNSPHGKGIYEALENRG